MHPFYDETKIRFLGPILLAPDLVSSCGRVDKLGICFAAFFALEMKLHFVG